MIRIEQLEFAYGDTPVLRGIDLEVRAGEIFGVLGSNGCGKSTLLRLMRGLLAPCRGRVLWEGRDVRRLSRKALARRAAVVPQGAAAGFPFAVREMVSLGRFAHQGGFVGAHPGDRAAVEKALALTDTLHLAEREVTGLSGGELQRVLLARALAQQAPVLLLDEATSHLDIDHRLEIGELLVRLNREQGLTVVHISHDLDQAAEISHRLLLLNADGSPWALGTPDEVFTPANLQQVFRVDVHVEKNPYTGAPRVYPVARQRADWGQGLSVHLLCGGGSGGDLLRRLYRSGARISVGPLNRGDSDLLLADALGLEAVREAPFCPISAQTLNDAFNLSRKAELMVVAPTVWGSGNLACLELADAALKEGRPVLVVDPRAERDYTGGRAWQTLSELLAKGAQRCADTAEVVDRLEKMAAMEKPPQGGL
ncbi:ABC transporter ATP-binding protein [Geoalkalibacter subterraneus]|jgi:iron complex transport system ATP-binding protein|uniref:ABC transporter ATP-binding protein n=1 Tax=Geoalkalibacter subterraneus TaxID=483547 RepID=UPI0006932AF6|nr:ABC transporter ATP-binding protein [Geoalkalibacter subterraneus]